jgi:hypothetical protein
MPRPRAATQGRELATRTGSAVRDAISFPDTAKPKKPPPFSAELALGLSINTTVKGLNQMSKSQRNDGVKVFDINLLVTHRRDLRPLAGFEHTRRDATVSGEFL